MRAFYTYKGCFKYYLQSMWQWKIQVPVTRRGEEVSDRRKYGRGGFAFDGLDEFLVEAHRGYQQQKPC